MPRDIFIFRPSSGTGMDILATISILTIDQDDDITRLLMMLVERRSIEARTRQPVRTDLSFNLCHSLCSSHNKDKTGLQVGRTSTMELTE